MSKNTTKNTDKELENIKNEQEIIEKNQKIKKEPVKDEKKKKKKKKKKRKLVRRDHEKEESDAKKLEEQYIKDPDNFKWENVKNMGHHTYERFMENMIKNPKIDKDKLIIGFIKSIPKSLKYILKELLFSKYIPNKIVMDYIMDYMIENYREDILSFLEKVTIDDENESQKECIKYIVSNLKDEEIIKIQEIRDKNSDLFTGRKEFLTEIIKNIKNSLKNFFQKDYQLPRIYTDQDKSVIVSLNLSDTNQKEYYDSLFDKRFIDILHEQVKKLDVNIDKTDIVIQKNKNNNFVDIEIGIDPIKLDSAIKMIEQLNDIKLYSGYKDGNSLILLSSKNSVIKNHKQISLFPVYDMTDNNQESFILMSAGCNVTQPTIKHALTILIELKILNKEDNKPFHWEHKGVVECIGLKSSICLDIMNNLLKSNGFYAYLNNEKTSIKYAGQHRMEFVIKRIVKDDKHNIKIDKMYESEKQLHSRFGILSKEQLDNCKHFSVDTKDFFEALLKELEDKFNKKETTKENQSEHNKYKSNINKVIQFLKEICEEKEDEKDGSDEELLDEIEKDNNQKSDSNKKKEPPSPELKPQDLQQVRNNNDNEHQPGGGK